jgi:hypothetical protein
MHSHAEITILLFALLLHEAGRAPTNAEQPGSFVEFADLSENIQADYTAIAANLLNIVEPWRSAAGSKPFADAIDWLARHISDAAARAGVDGDRAGKTGFDSMAAPAQAFRRAQATYLLARFGFKDAISDAAAA